MVSQETESFAKAANIKAATPIASVPPELVDHPAHYRTGTIECIEALEAIGVAEDFCRGCVIKYAW